MKPTLLPNPIKCPAGYTMDLYCKYDNPNHGLSGEAGPSLYGRDGREVRLQARRKGWTLHTDGTATCPICIKAIRGEPR